MANAKEVRERVHFICLKRVYRCSCYNLNCELLGFFLSFSVCPVGKYGVNCSLSCKCPRSAICDPYTAECFCKPGHQGTTCREGEYVRSSFSSCVLANEPSHISPETSTPMHEYLYEDLTYAEKFPNSNLLGTLYKSM